MSADLIAKKVRQGIALIARLDGGRHAIIPEGVLGYVRKQDEYQRRIEMLAATSDRAARENRVRRWCS